MTPTSRPDPDDLRGREAALGAREQQAVQGAGDADCLAELADERDRLADARDDAAERRDDAALARRERAHARDVAAVERDRRSRVLADDDDPGFPDRFMSARNVDASAGDRADALDDERQARNDRAHAREDRHRATTDRKAALHAAAAAADRREANMQIGLEGRTVIGQAQGLLMARYRISAEEAFQRLVQDSQTTNVKVRDVAARIVRENSAR